MESDLPNAEILTKVRDAHCLTEPELQSLSTAITEAQLRRELDAVDSQWENDMRKYVSLRRSKGGKAGLVIVSRGEGFAGILAGLGIASYDQSRDPGVIFRSTLLPSRCTVIVVSLPIFKSPMT
jgi:hypothetical protein